MTAVVEWSACRAFRVFSPKDVSLYTNSEQEADPTPKLAQNHVITQTMVLPELVRSSGVFLVVFAESEGSVGVLWLFFSNHTNHSTRVCNLDGCEILIHQRLLYSFLVPVSRAHWLRELWRKRNKFMYGYSMGIFFYQEASPSPFQQSKLMFVNVLTNRFWAEIRVVT